MNYRTTYIEHDRRNCSVRTLSEAELRLHYGSNVLSVVFQDGSASLSNGIDIYLDSCYPSVSKMIAAEVKNEMQSM